MGNELLLILFGGDAVFQAGLTAALVAGSLLTTAAGTYMQHEKMEQAEEARKKAKKRRQKARQRKEERLNAEQRREQRRRDKNQQSLARRARAEGRSLLISDQGPTLGDTSSGGNSSEGTTSTLG